jgi:hypothetical protein
VLSLFKRRNLLTEKHVENLANWKSNGGFSVNADVHIDGEDRKGAARLIRYCARPAFSGEKLVLLSEKTETADKTRLQYDVSKHSQKTEPPLNLSATELFDNLSKLISRPRRHRHHYHGVLAPNSPCRSEVIEFAKVLYRPEAAINNKLNESLNVLANEAILICLPKKGSQSWAKLIAQVYEVDPLKSEQCGETMKLIAFIKDNFSIKTILSHLGEASEAPKLYPPRGPPEECDVGEEFPVEPDSDYQYDQTVNG